MIDHADQWLLLLANVSLKSLLLAAMAAVGLAVFRVRNSHVRHRVWTTVLVGMLLMPLLAKVLPGLPIPVPAMVSARQSVPPIGAGTRARVISTVGEQPEKASAQQVAVASPLHQQGHRDDSSVEITRVDKSSAATVLIPTSLGTVDAGGSAAVSSIPAGRMTILFSTLLLTYLGISLLLALRLTIGLVRARRLVRASLPIDGQDRFLPVSRCGVLRESRAIRVPLTVGVLKPRVLLPASWRTWRAEKRDAVIRHELAHVARGDCLVNLLAEINRCLYWFHPLAWFLTRRLSSLAEQSCDDAVIAATGERAAYARHLLEIAASVVTPPSVAMRTGVSMARSADVSVRIEAILDTTRPLSKRLCWRHTLCLVAITSSACWFTAALQAENTGPPTAIELPDVNSPETPVTDVSPLLALQQAPAVRDEAADSADRADADFVIAGQCLRRDDRNTTIPGIRIRLLAVQGIREERHEVAETLSDARGEFRFERLPPPSQHRLEPLQYYLIATGEGRGVYVAKVWNPAEAETTRLSLAETSAPLHGRVQDERGTPVKGARLELYSSGLTGLDMIPATETDENGEFLLRGVPVRMDRQGDPVATSIVVTHPDFPETTHRAESLPSVVTFTLIDGCRVRGVVKEASSGKLRVGAVVTALPAAARSGHQEQAITDAEGRFQFNLHEGTYNVILEDDRNRVATAVTDLECRKGDHIELPPLLAEEGGWLTGQVIHTQTSQPMVFNSEGRRVTLGLYGPSRPAGRLRHQHLLTEVDDEGRFRMRAAVGENFPYLMNLRGERMAWDTTKQEPVVVVAGRETSCVMEFTPEPTGEEQMEAARKVLAALPAETDKRVAAIIEEFRKLNHTVDECEIWCLLMRELVTIGKPAVLPLCEEFEATDQQRMMRRLAFALRAIGDPRAVPTLIRVFPKMLQPSMSDYGLIVADHELAAFMREHSIGGGAGDRGGQYFSFGRPVRETHHALTHLTQRNVDGRELFGMHRAADLRALARQEKRFHEAAQEWAAWWEANWEQFKVEESFSKVGLRAYTSPDLSAYPRGLEVSQNATVDGGSMGRVLTPVGDSSKSADFFLDLDTGGEPRWPAELARDDSSPEAVQAAGEWAAKRGADLMCVEMPDEEGHVGYMLVGIGLQLWEIDPFDAKNIEKRVKEGQLPSGREVGEYLFHYDPESRKQVAQRGTSFIYVTREQGLGVITITDFVTEVRDITGSFAAPQGVGFHRGVRFDYKVIAR